MVDLGELSNKISTPVISIALFLVGQAIAAVIWGAHMDGKITENAHQIEEQGKHIEILDSVGGRQVHRTVARLEALEKAAERMDAIVRTMPVLDERTQTLRLMMNEMSLKTTDISRAYRSFIDDNAPRPDGSSKYKLQSADDGAKFLPSFTPLPCKAVGAC